MHLRIYAKEVESHLSKLSLANDIKENWRHLKNDILEVGCQFFRMCVGDSWYDEICKI